MKYCPNPECPHLLRHRAFSEYQDRVSVCSDCGTPLQDGEPPEIQPPVFRDLITIYQARNPIQAHLVRAMLEEEGIPVYLKGELLSGAVGELPTTVAYVEVQVPPECAARARELALEIERSDD